jgi:hypothetical protein
MFGEKPIFWIGSGAATVGAIAMEYAPQYPIIPIAIFSMGVAMMLLGLRDMYRQERAPKRIPLTEMREMARKLGWPITLYEYSSNDFLRGLCQAAVDGALVLYGKEQQSLDDLTRKEPLMQIEAAHWKRFAPAIRPFIEAEDNFDNFSIAGGIDAGYFDLHISTEGLGRWLRQEAPKYRGYHDEREAAQQREAEAFFKEVGKP